MQNSLAPNFYNIYILFKKSIYEPETADILFVINLHRVTPEAKDNRIIFPRKSWRFMC